MVQRHVDLPPGSILYTHLTMRSVGLYLVVLYLVIVLAGCGPNRTTTSTNSAGPGTVATISIDEFPTGIGRGYPVASVISFDAESTGVEAGELAANFRLELEDGSTLSLHDLQGRPVMLNFWATWCGPCRIEMPEIVKQYDSNDELVVLAVNVREELELVQAFSEQFAMSMPVVLDVEGDVQDLYEVRAMPTSVFIDRNGTIVARFAGIVTPDRLQGFLRLIL